MRRSSGTGPPDSSSRGPSPFRCTVPGLLRLHLLPTFGGKDLDKMGEAQLGSDRAGASGRLKTRGVLVT